MHQISKVIALFCTFTCFSWGFPGGSIGKESACKAGDRLGFDPWVGKIPWRKKWEPTPVFLLGESHRQGSLRSYGPWGYKESNTTEVTAHST